MVCSADRSVIVHFFYFNLLDYMAVRNRSLRLIESPHSSHAVESTRSGGLHRSEQGSGCSIQVGCYCFRLICPVLYQPSSVSCSDKLCRHAQNGHLIIQPGHTVLGIALQTF